MKRTDCLAEVGHVRVADAWHRHELRHARRRAEAQSGASATYKDLSFGGRYRYAAFEKCKPGELNSSAILSWSCDSTCELHALGHDGVGDPLGMDGLQVAVLTNLRTRYFEYA